MQTKKITVLGLCVALAMILSYIESILPVFVGIPGAKLGLPNMVIVLLLYLMGAKEAVCVNILRILLSGFLFGKSVQHFIQSGRRYGQLFCHVADKEEASFHQAGQCAGGYFS